MPEAAAYKRHFVVVLALAPTNHLLRRMAVYSHFMMPEEGLEPPTRGL
jgi:hypothetical protein